MGFFDRLYSGFEAEYLVMGRIYASGLEAFKLPGDFGYDLLVTDLKTRSLDGQPASRALPLPYPLQIKSRKLQAHNLVPGPNGRNEIRVGFWIRRKASSKSGVTATPSLCSFASTNLAQAESSSHTLPSGSPPNTSTS